MDTRRGVNLSRIQRQGDAKSFAGVLFLYPSSVGLLRGVARRSTVALQLCKNIHNIPM